MFVVDWILLCDMIYENGVMFHKTDRMESFFSKIAGLELLLKGPCFGFFPVNFSILFEALVL